MILIHLLHIYIVSPKNGLRWFQRLNQFLHRYQVSLILVVHHLEHFHYLNSIHFLVKLRTWGLGLDKTRLVIQMHYPLLLCWAAHQQSF